MSDRNIGKEFEEKKESINTPVRRLFAEFGKDNPLLLFVTVSASVAAPLLSLVPPYIIKVVIDDVLRDSGQFGVPFLGQYVSSGSQWDMAIVSVSLIVASAVLLQFVTVIKDGGWQLFSERIQHNVRTSAYERTQHLGVDFFNNNQTGQLVSILNNDINELDNFLTDYISNLIHIVTGLIGAAVVMFSLNWQLALVTLFPIPFMATFSAVYAGKIRDKYGAVRKAVGNLHSRVEASIRGILTVKAFVAEDYEYDRVQNSSNDYFSARWEMRKIRTLFFPSLNLANYLGFAVTVLVGSYWIVVGPPGFFSGELTTGTLVAFLTYNRQFNTPLIKLGTVLDQYEKARSSLVRVFALADCPVQLADGDVSVSSVDGRVTYRSVFFSYPDSDECAVDGVSFNVAPGESIGIVGPTGSGKSTLMRLLLRFHDPDSGQVDIDGTDIRDIQVEDLRGAIGYVSQDPFVFDDTVAANIGYGAPEATREEIVEAAKTANAHEFIRELSDGYDTQVGESGTTLSGGQRQRLTIARAVLQDPEILVMDEALSHVDNRTGYLIKEGIDRLTDGRTTFVIAHRLSTVRDADRIFVVEDGQIVQRGSHEQLLQTSGLYDDLWSLQVGDYQSVTPEFRSRVVERRGD